MKKIVLFVGLLTFVSMTLMACEETKEAINEIINDDDDEFDNVQIKITNADIALEFKGCKILSNGDVRYDFLITNSGKDIKEFITYFIDGNTQAIDNEGNEYTDISGNFGSSNGDIFGSMEGPLYRDTPVKYSIIIKDVDKNTTLFKRITLEYFISYFDMNAEKGYIVITDMPVKDK